jgi:hypothetical protein
MGLATSMPLESMHLFTQLSDLFRPFLTRFKG